MTQQSNSQRLAIMPVDVSFLEQLFSLPEGYSIVGVSLRKDTDDILDFVLSSDALPEVQEGKELPRAKLHFTLDTLREHPEFRRITTEVKLL